MTPLQVCLFKQFTVTKGMESMFISMYRKWHCKTNPLILEEFLRKADPVNVFMTAFYFQINQKFGFDFWQRMQNQFLDFLKKEEKKHKDEDWTSLRGVFKDLRLNWDAPKHWAYEKREDAAKRLGIMLPEQKEKAIREAEEELHKEAEAMLQAASQQEVFASVPEYADAHGLDIKPDEQKPQVDDAPFDDFDEFNIIDLKPRSHNSTRLKDDEISFNLRNKKSCITFNQTVSAEIRERGGYEYAAVANEKDGVVLVLNDVKGVPMVDGKAGKNGKDVNATINSKVLCARLEALLNITDNYTILKIREYKRNSNYVAYKVSLK